MIAKTLSVLILFLLKHKVTYATMWPSQRYTELNVYLQGFTLESFKVDTIFECYRKCEENIHCGSINMNLTNKTCELKYSTKTRYPEKTVNQSNTIYMEIRDTTIIPSCKKLKEDDSQAKSGVYWMKFNESSSVPFQVFCDLTTDGGGWTLVYSYTFTNYEFFGRTSNAVTPIPTWPADLSVRTFSPQSTTTPINESSHSAMDFALWKKIGSEFLYTSNITNWYACEDKLGSLVYWKSGTLNCRQVKNIVPPPSEDCALRAPKSIVINKCGGIQLRYGSAKMINLDGKVDGCVPVHHSCGSGSTQSNHLRNVINPGGKLYIR